MKSKLVRSLQGLNILEGQEGIHKHNAECFVIKSRMQGHDKIISECEK